MTLELEELGTREFVWLSPVVLARGLMPIVIFLAAALWFDSWVVKVILYLVSAVFLWTGVMTYGMTVIAAGIAIIGSYLYLEIDGLPHWTAYILGALIIVQVGFIRHHFKELDELRKRTADTSS